MCGRASFLISYPHRKCGSRTKGLLFCTGAGNSCFLGDVCMRRLVVVKEEEGGWWWLVLVRLWDAEKREEIFGWGVDPPKGFRAWNGLRPTNPDQGPVRFLIK